MSRQQRMFLVSMLLTIGSAIAWPDGRAFFGTLFLINAVFFIWSEPDKPKATP